MSVEDALVHLDDALDALTLEGWTSSTAEPGSWERMPPILSTIAIELERIDSALGIRGQSMFYPLSEQIKRAVIAITAAKQSLEK